MTHNFQFNDPIPGPIHVARSPYPETVAESLREGVRYRPGVLAATRDYRASRPWAGTDHEVFEKLVDYHQALCRIYGVRPSLSWHPGPYGGDHFNSRTNHIHLYGPRISVITYLHELGHARGFGERKTCRFSLNLFRRMFPRSWARLRPDRHMMRRP